MIALLVFTSADRSGYVRLSHVDVRYCSVCYILQCTNLALKYRYGLPSARKDKGEINEDRVATKKSAKKNISYLPVFSHCITTGIVHLE